MFLPKNQEKLWSEEIINKIALELILYLSFFQCRFEAWCKFYRFELTNQLSNNIGYTLLLIEIPVKMVN